MDNLIIKSNIKFNNRFDFSEPNYVNSRTKIKIKCKLHNKIIYIIPSANLTRTYGGCDLCRKFDKSNIILYDNERIVLEKVVKINILINEIIKIYDSIVAAYDNLNELCSSLISRICSGKECKTIFGFKWKFIE